MAKEIERKFLIHENKVDFSTKEFLSLYNTFDDLKEDIFRNGLEINQGYFFKFLPIIMKVPIPTGML